MSRGDSPDFAEAHYNLGTVLDKKGNRTEAVEEFRAALKLNPNDPDFQAAGERLLEN